MKAYRDKHGLDLLHVPAVLEALVPVYNLPGVAEALNFTPVALAGIFLGTITKWNDPAIAQANPEVNLPNLNIVVVHRSGGRSNHVWSDYLGKISPERKSKVGPPTDVFTWPLGLAVESDDALLNLIKEENGAIGHSDVPYVAGQKVAYGNVRNRAGAFVRADLASLTGAASSASAMPADVRASITDAPGKTAYPIAKFTWLLVPRKIADPGKKQAITAFLTWALDDGQSLAESLGFAKLPANVISEENAAIAQIQ